MRSVISAWVARRAAAPPRSRPRRSRAASASLAILAAITVLAWAGAALAGAGARRVPAAARAHRASAPAASTSAATGVPPTPTTPAPPATPVPPQPPQPPPPPGRPKPPPRQRYRIVGCRSHGFSAYLSGPRRREVAIGFDDGPWPDTGAFVQMLERRRVRATFFLIGEQVTPGYRATLLRELRDGDVLGDHSFNHPDLTRSGDVHGELQHTLARIRAVTGYSPCIFRPPYGAYDGSVVSTARSLGLATVLWNDDPRDWALPGTDAIRQRVLSQVQPGSMIISHDGGGPRGETLAAYPGIIAGLRARGYRIVTIPELLGFRPVYMPCVRLCATLGVPRSAVPRRAIIEHPR